MIPPPGSPSPGAARSPAGLVLLRKPAGLTSFQALGAVKRSLGTKKVGHAGTLDRFATGLLIGLCGSYCRLAAFAEAGEKLYRGIVAFGRETSTLDPEGELVAEGPIPTRDAVEEALGRFRGSILQRPPLYSAVHLDGKRAYQRARAGESPEMPERRVEIRELSLESYVEGCATIVVRCSPGTYIRSLARDIGRACGSPAHLAALERKGIGPFRVEEGCAPDDFAAALHLRRVDAGLARALGLEPVAAAGDEVHRFVNGGCLDRASLKALAALPRGLRKDCAVFDPRGELLGVVELEGDRLRYRVVLGEAEEARP